MSAETGRERVWLVVLLAMIGAVAAGSLLVIARHLYDDGATPVTVLLVRAVGLCLLLSLGMKMTGNAIRLPPGERYKSIALGLALAGFTWCNYTAVTFIPVSLSTLILYTHPLLVALAVRVIERERVGLAQTLALLAAFAGTALILQVAPEGQLDPRGVGLVAIASIGFAIVLIASNRILKRADSRRMTVHVTLATSLCYAAAMIVSGGPELPRSAANLPLLAAMPLLYLAAILFFFMAIKRLGPVRAAMITNLEPVATVGLATLLLGERLTPLQYAGGALVIGAIAAVQVATLASARRGAA